MTDNRQNNKTDQEAANPASPKASDYLQVPTVNSGIEISKSGSDISRTPSERVLFLLKALKNYESLYLCPVSSGLPDAILAKLSSFPRRMYEVKDYYGATQYYAVEMNSCCNFYFCSNNRTFEIYMYSSQGDVIFESVRSCSKVLCLLGGECCCCCGGGIETAANFRHEENYIGSVVSVGNCVSPTFIIQNDDSDEKFYIRGRKWSLLIPCRLCCVEQFSICKPKTSISLGKIRRGYDGLTEDLIPNPDTIGVVFPPRCTPEIKALLLAAGFMLDVSYFQNKGITAHRIIRQIINIVSIGGFLGAIVCVLYLIICNMHS